MKPIFVHVHIYYTDMWEQLKDCLKNIAPYSYELYITMIEEHFDIQKDILSFKKDATIEILENRGYDIGPFVHAINKIDVNNYSYVIKLHTKRDMRSETYLSSIAMGNGDWRDALLEFIATKENFQKCLESFGEERTLGCISNYKCIIDNKLLVYTKEVKKRLENFLENHSLNKKDFSFVAGSMFIIRADILKKLQNVSLSLQNFEEPIVEGYRDGQLAHVIERFLGAIVYQEGYTIQDIFLCPVLNNTNFISVVRNFEMYERLVKNNVFNNGAEFIFFDNREENKSISVRYNSFLDSYDYSKPSWFIFCHEDWQMKDNWNERLANLNTQALYGPIGRNFEGLWGQILESDKTGTNKLRHIGNFCRNLLEVHTFDCQCLIVHSSLIEKYTLRFDENLSFDLYVEDFCVNAKEKYGIISYILQMRCHHYSRGYIGKNFYRSLRYVKLKYKDAHGSYLAICSNEIIGKLTLKHLYARIIDSVYMSKITKSNRRLIKICKIPVWWKKIKS